MSDVIMYKLQVPDKPIIPYIEGDGIGVDITTPSLRVLDCAVEKAYKGKRKIEWKEIYAGEKGKEKRGSYLPEETLKAISTYRVALKGPLTTPIGSGFRSLNVALRQKLDLYACVRPVRYFKGVPSPLRHPEHMDVVIFRENTEDVYAGIEWASQSKEAQALIRFMHTEFHTEIRDSAAIGIKPVSEFASKRLVRSAIQYAIARKRRSVTLVHKGNIMKFTEGAFKNWGYELAKEDFSDQVVLEEEAKEGDPRIIIKDRIADSMFQQILTRTEEYDVIATTNLNGDYLSDACAAQVGGLGMAPGGNIGDGVALFEATHGTAPKYAGQDKVNPTSVLLSGVMLLEYLGWEEAADKVYRALEETIHQKRVTYDLERQMRGATLLSSSGFTNALIENIP